MTHAPTDGSGYPRLAADTSEDVARKLVEIVTDHHPDGLTEDQLRQVRAAIAAQIAAAERLHRFPLRNDQEPIFAVRGPFGVVA